MKKIFEYKITNLILCTIFFLPLCIIVFSGNSIFFVNDDFIAISLLKSGESHVFMISYPLAVLLVLAYKAMPLIPWYSIVSTATLALSSIIFFKAIKLLIEKNFYFYFIFFFIGLIFYSFSIKNISISVITVIYFATSFLILLWEHKLKFFLFSLSMSICFLLRDFYAIFIIFFSIIILLFLISKIIFNLEYSLFKKEYLFILLPLIIIFFDYFGYSSSEYKEWIKFNSARAIQNDCYQFIPEGDNLVNRDNIIVFKLWYPYDQEVLPTQTIIKVSGSFLQVYKNAFKIINIKNFIKTKITIHYKYFIFLVIILILALLTCEKSKFRLFILYLISNLTLIALLFSIIFIRDVERLTVGLFFVIFCYNLIFICNYCCSGNSEKFIKKYKIFIFIILFLTMAAFWSKDLSYTLTNQDIKNNFKKELTGYNEFRKGYEEYTFMPCILLPYYMCNFFVIQNFYEDDSIGNFTNQNFFPVGWLARSPYFYRKLHEKGFYNFYDFLMDPKTLFFGSNIISTEFNEKYIKYLDSNFGNNHYKHYIKTIKINDMFSFSKIMKVKQ